nr:immunoglobulin heavy chain junction region [Mus musculus]
LCKGNWVVCLL